MKKTVSAAAAVSFLVMGAVAGCSDASGNSAAEGEPGGSGAPVTMETLEGSWSFQDGQVSGGNLQAPEGTPVDLVVDADGAFHGNSGCNSIMGEVTVAEGTVDLGAIGVTRMACEEPQMAFETEYLSALETVTEGSVDGDLLTLTGAEALLHYVKDN